MSENLRTLGLISGRISLSWERNGKNLGYEARKLLAAARKIYGNAVVINPRLVSIELPRGGRLPLIYHDGKPLVHVDSLVLRSTRHMKGLPAIINSLSALGSDILDPRSRKNSRGSSKLSSSVSRFESGVGSTTYLAYGHEAARDLAKRIAKVGAFPLIGKPEDGRGGKGVTKIHNREELDRYIKKLFSTRKKTVLLLQPFENFLSEFRVVTFFGKPIGIARKIPAIGSIAANAARGGTFVPDDRPDVVDYVNEKCSRIGILGVDVGETENGEFRIIEANRAPKWEEFDRALKIDTAREIVALARDRLD